MTWPSGLSGESVDLSIAIGGSFPVGSPFSVSPMIDGNGGDHGNVFNVNPGYVETDVRVELYNLGGRRIRTLADGWRPAGPGQVHWDGRDASGAPAPAGVYHVRLSGAAGTLMRRLVRLD